MINVWVSLKRNAGKKAIKKIETFGLITFMINPCLKSVNIGLLSLVEFLVLIISVDLKTWNAKNNRYPAPSNLSPKRSSAFDFIKDDNPKATKDV